MTLSHVCSVVSTPDVPSAQLLVRDVRRHLPGAKIVLLALPGARTKLRQALDDDVDVRALRDVSDASWDAAVVALPAREVARIARPLLVRQVLRDGASAVMLVPPDASLLSAPGTLVEHLDAGAHAVLVPRLRGPIPDARRPDARDLDAAGPIDDELGAFGSGSLPLVEWWAMRCAQTRPPVEGHFVPGDAAEHGPSSPLSTAARSFAGVRLSEDPGVGVSYWNLHERPLARTHGALTAGGHAVSVMSYPGFRPDRPWWLSEHGTRVEVIDDAVLAELCRDRAHALVAAGWTSPHRREGTVELANQLLLDDRLRRLHAEALDEREDFGDLDEPAAAEAFMRWLGGPAAIGAASGLTRYAFDVWRSREDVQRAYPDLDGPDGEGFSGWLWVHGRPEADLDARLLPPPPAWYDPTHTALPPVLVAGYLRGALGLGAAARGYVEALRAAQVDVATTVVLPDADGAPRPDGENRGAELDHAEQELDAAPGVVLVCVNAPQLPEVIDQLGDEAIEGRYVIGQWAWETTTIPERWDTSFDLVDEIWTYSTYVADVIARASSKPVIAVPLPVTPPADVAADHGLALPSSSFTFLFAFDFLSTLQRKNPLGLVEAFKAAFAPGEGPTLVLKTTNAARRPQERDCIRYAIGDRTDIALVDAMLTPPQLARLFADAHCYVSLHRSEGFGLTLAESMLLGKPVIATAYGGNTDFMSAANSYLVDYELTDVGPEGEHYPAGGSWAEPSVEHAAHLMRETWEDRDGAAARGTRARADIVSTLNPEAVGAIARARLERIAVLRSRTASGDAQAIPDPIGALDSLLHFDLDGGGPGGARGLARRGALRIVRPYARAERRYDEAVERSLRVLAQELGQLRAARERDRDRIARLEQRLRRR